MSGIADARRATTLRIRRPSATKLHALYDPRPFALLRSCTLAGARELRYPLYAHAGLRPGPGNSRLESPVQRFATSDIDETNRHPPPGWTQVVYRLGEGPFRYEFVRVDLGDGVDLEHARFRGATRFIGTLAPDAIHVLFPYGRDLRLSGVSVNRRLVVVSPPAVQFEGSTQVEGCGFSIVARGPPSTRCSRPASPERRCSLRDAPRW